LLYFQGLQASTCLVITTTSNIENLQYLQSFKKAPVLSAAGLPDLLEHCWSSASGCYCYSL